MTNSEHPNVNEVSQVGRRGLDEQHQRVEDERQTGRWRGTHSFRGSSVATAHPPDWKLRHWTSRLLHRIGELAAHSGAGILAALLVASWAGVGVFAGFPSWWQITLYSVAGSVTFVMVFVIQHTQERQTSATQRKLDELIRSSLRADDNLIAVEHASDQNLQALGSLSLADRMRVSGDVAHAEPSATTPDQ